jgi:hypothetical protein
VDTSPGVPTAYALGRYYTIACRSTADWSTDPAGQGADYIAANSGHSINISLGVSRFYRWTLDWLARNGINPRRP